MYITQLDRESERVLSTLHLDIARVFYGSLRAHAM